MPRLPRLAHHHRILLPLGPLRGNYRPTPTCLSRSNPTDLPLGQNRQIAFHIIIPLPERSTQLNPVTRSLKFEVSLSGSEVIRDIPGFGRVLRVEVAGREEMGLAFSTVEGPGGGGVMQENKDTHCRASIEQFLVDLFGAFIVTRSVELPE